MNQPLFNFHILELRWRFFYALFSSLITAWIAYLYVVELLSLLAHPLILSGNNQFVYTNLSEAFFSYFRLSIFIGFFWSSPIWILQFIRFLQPGIFYTEFKTFKRSTILGFFFLIFGLFIFFFFISPFIFQFFVGFQDFPNSLYSLEFLVKLSDLVSFLINSLILISIFFGFPGFLALNEQFHKILRTICIKYRALLWFFILILSGILTPPDVVSQILFSLPLAFTIELSYFISCIGSQYSN